MILNIAEILVWTVVVISDNQKSFCEIKLWAKSQPTDVSLKFSSSPSILDLKIANIDFPCGTQVSNERGITLPFANDQEVAADWGNAVRGRGRTHFTSLQNYSLRLRTDLPILLSRIQSLYVEYEAVRIRTQFPAFAS